MSSLAETDLPAMKVFSAFLCKTKFSMYFKKKFIKYDWFETKINMIYCVNTLAYFFVTMKNSSLPVKRWP